MPTTRTVIRSLLILGFLLIVIGHITIMASGEMFNPVTSEHFNLHTRWVSDFAAKWPQGSWVKAGILLACIATLLLYRDKIKGLDPSARNSWEAWFYHIVPLLIIGGLTMVLSFDISLPRSQWAETGWWIFKTGSLTTEERKPSDWTVEWYHQLGFRIFVAGYFFAAAGGLWLRLKKDLRSVEPSDWLLVAVSLLLSIWLFTSMNSLPGIPQRSLLIAAFIWLWQEGATAGIRLRQVPVTPQTA